MGIIKIALGFEFDVMMNASLIGVQAKTKKR